MSRYHSPRELAHALQDAAPVNLGLLFFNEHRPDTTPVWLLPDPYEKPAHHRAKLGIWPWGDDGNEVFVQWCVEKGVEGSAAPHFASSDILGPEWAWTPFMARAHDKTFDARLRKAETKAGMPLTVRISLGTATPGRGRDYQGTKAQDIIWHTQQGQLIRQDNPKQPGHIFNEGLPEAHNIRTLALLLPQTAELDWCWIDFGVGVVLPLRQDTLSAAEVWEWVISPWAEWL